METTCVIKKPQKKQKLNEEKDVDGNSKCLSNLPEEVLRHILSFLSTKDAVRTSLLSKRWEYLWASIPNLDFEKYEPAKRTHLMNFVEKVLCLRDSSDIKRFTLRCDDVLCDASRVYTWISTAVRHNVQELNIELDNFEGEFSLPYCLFTCKTLTSLSLNMWYILKLPTTICFSNLKILTMEYVTFPNEYLTQQLFSGLPVLEELELKNCSWGGLKFVSISAPKLHSLSIFETKMPDANFWNYSDVCQVMIVGDSLKEFYYKGILFSDYCLCKSFSLEKAEIDTHSEFLAEQFGRRSYKLLIGLSNVKLLRLSSDVVEFLMDAAEHLPHMPMFNNLMDLIFVVYSVDLDCTILLKILQKFPCLKTLNFFEGISLSNDWKEDDSIDRIFDPVPPCFLSHLKCIKVGRYCGDKKELSAVKTLLKYAVVLDEIIITCSKHFAGNLEKQVKVFKQLLELPRCSQNCKIILE